MLVAEFGMAEAVVAGHAQDDAAMPRELVLVVGEVDGLDGAARGIVLGIEIQNGVILAAQLRQVEGLHVGVGQCKGWRWLTGLQHAHSWPQMNGTKFNTGNLAASKGLFPRMETSCKVEAPCFQSPTRKP